VPKEVDAGGKQGQDGESGTAVPGYALAIARLDRIGHRRLQLAGFAVMALCFAVIALVPGMTTMVAPFLLLYGVSYFFTEFGPNMTTFVLPSELYPVSMRTTGHGISAGIGKLGAFIGSSCSRCRPLAGWFALVC
jgi:MFS transporter, PHS family, inorganic phosphate transporter